MRGIPYPGVPVAPINKPPATFEGISTELGTRDDSRSSSSSYIPPPNPYPTTPIGSNLPDLLELEEIREKVIWPIGVTSSTAKQYLSDYALAINTAYMYTPLYHSNPEQPEDDETAPAVRIQRRTALDVHPSLKRKASHQVVGSVEGEARVWFSKKPNRVNLHPLPFNRIDAQTASRWLQEGSSIVSHPHPPPIEACADEVGKPAAGTSAPLDVQHQELSGGSGGSHVVSHFDDPEALDLEPCSSDDDEAYMYIDP